jgi:large subunit ribosomal protein L35
LQKNLLIPFFFRIFAPQLKINNQKNPKQMPKMKTKSAAKKRFSFTGTGKIKRKHAFKSHILTKKSTKRKRNLTYSTIVDKADVNNVRLMLCV